MKELVSWPLTEAAKVADVHELEPSLQAIYEAMWEMKSHGKDVFLILDDWHVVTFFLLPLEYIENHYIMDRLKQRLQSRRVSNIAILMPF